MSLTTAARTVAFLSQPEARLGGRGGRRARYVALLRTGAGDDRSQKITEQRMRAVGPRLELGMELGADHPGVIRHLGDLHQPPVGRKAAENQPLRRQPLPIVIVELEAMAVALENDRLAVGRVRP